MSRLGYHHGAVLLSDEIFVGSHRKHQYTTHIFYSMMESTPTRPTTSTQPSHDELLVKKTSLEEILRQKEEELNRLKSEKGRKERGELDDLIDKWRTVCQNALVELHGKSVSCGGDCVESDKGLGHFLDRVGVDKSLVKFSDEDESFY